MMTKSEQEVVSNIIERLSAANCDCCNDMGAEKIVAEANAKGIEAVSRLYLDTWVIPALQMLLSGEGRNVELARRLSGR